MMATDLERAHLLDRSKPSDRADVLCKTLNNLLQRFFMSEWLRLAKGAVMPKNVGITEPKIVDESRKHKVMKASSLGGIVAKFALLEAVPSFTHILSITHIHTRVCVGACAQIVNAN